MQSEQTQLHSVTVCAEPIPEEQAEIYLPANLLSVLPEGAQYRASNGRASVSAKRAGDSIILTGRCDSVFRKMIRFEETVFYQQSVIDSLKNKLTKSEWQAEKTVQKERKITSTPMWVTLIHLLTGFCLFPMIKKIIQLLKKQRLWTK